VGIDLRGEIAGHDDSLGDARLGHQLELPGEDRLAPYFQQAFRSAVGQRPKPRAGSGGEDDGGQVRGGTGQFRPPG
jgi:hypothetical protein